MKYVFEGKSIKGCEKIKMFSHFRSLKTGILNLIKWFPIIYNDRDWDYYFIYAILHKKLDNMEKFFNSDKAWTSKSEGVAEQIKEVKILCENLMNDNYLSEALKPFDEKYGEVSLFKIIDHKLEYNVDDEAVLMHRECGKFSDKNREEDKNKLFDLIKKNIDNWWD
jgi:hypothetical protein